MPRSKTKPSPTDSPDPVHATMLALVRVLARVVAAEVLRAPPPPSEEANHGA
jgi:hypothetical protein